MEIKLTLNSGLLWNMIAYLFYAKYMEVLLFFLRSIKLNQSIKQNYFFVTMFCNLLHKKLVKTLTWSLSFQEVWEVLEVLEILEDLKICQICEVLKFQEFKFLNLLDKKLVKTMTRSLFFPRGLGGSGGFGDPSTVWRLEFSQLGGSLIQGG